VKIVRLDAVAFVVKKPGTSCFFVEPEIYEFLDWIEGEAGLAGIELLSEVHAHYSIQDKLVEHGHRVYNFVLPLLILHAVQEGTSLKLQEYLKTCPRRQFTMLDCHDGIPVQPDLDDVLTIDEAQKVVRTCLERGANLSRILSASHKRREDFDAHQINITYYSALAAQDDPYFAARAIQLFSPGVPQVYYVGLLAGENDQGEVERTGERRAINRRNYTVEEVEAALQKPVVKRLLELIRFRNTYGAFDGDFEVLNTPADRLNLAWQKGEKRCVLDVDLATCRAQITYRDASGQERVMAS
jgi:sucrose phosphorylase